MSVEMREKALAEAKTWIGTPYHHQAQIKGVGVDCATLLTGVYHAIGAVPKIELGEYSVDWHMHRSDEKYLGWIEKFGKQTDAPKAGDIALFKFGRVVSHGGIIVDDGIIIHAYYRRGCVYEELDSHELRGRLHSIWTLWDD